ncbi:MAG TPA: FMN-binding negative transcriptional regulator [Rhizomicrobium sp.]
MYRPAAFAIDDPARLRRFIRDNPFATVAAAPQGRVVFAYAPVIVDDDGMRFHLAAANPLAQMSDGARLSFSVLGPHAYVSPDWYESKSRVPTWNYCAVEGEGVVRRLDRDALRELLVDLSAAEETRLAPKDPWTIDQVPEDRMETMLTAIVGFAVRFETLAGKFKLSQNVSAQDAAGAIAGLDARGDAAGAAVAAAMRTARAATGP